MCRLTGRSSLLAPQVPPETRPSLDDVARDKLAALERRQLRRRLAVTDAARRRARSTRAPSSSRSRATTTWASRTIPRSSPRASKRRGATASGAGSSRLVNGNHPLYAELERKLAALKGTEDAVVFGSGYLTNFGVIPALVGRADLILLDELSHSCLLTGARLSGAACSSFATTTSRTWPSCCARARAHRHCLVLTDGVFSMEGDLAPLPALAALAAEHDAWLMTDDAHGLGVVGDGRGSSFASAPPVAVPLQMGTLSKAVGCYGGYLCTSRDVAELVRNRARSFVYSTGLPPGTVAAASRALDLIATDKELVRRPLDARARVHGGARFAAGDERDRVAAHRQRRAGARGERARCEPRASSSRRSGRRPCRPARRGCA